MTDIVIPVADEPRNLFLPIALDLIAANTNLRPVLVGAATMYEWAVRERFPTYLLVDTIQEPGGEHAVANTDKAMWTAIDHAEVSDPFVWSNDDIFVREPVGLDVIEEAGSTSRGSLAALVDSGYYGRLNHHTSILLREAGRPEHDYERHVPMLVDKTMMRAALTFGGAKRSVYQNLSHDKPVAVQADVKMFVDHRGKPITGVPDGPFLSVSPKFPIPELVRILG